MKKAISALLIFIFSLLSLIHFYWGFGGKWGFENALPTDENNIKVLSPANFDSFLVAFVLAGFSFFYLSLFSKQKLWIKFLRFFIPSIFLLRTIGDFKFVGFFKTIKTTNFSILDTNFYTPLCLFISLMGLYLAFKKY